MNTIDRVDESDNVIGTSTIKEAHEKGFLHRIAVVYLVRENGCILVQERRDGRLDHSAAGHVDTGETYLVAAQRELKEELGVDAELECLAKAFATPHFYELFVTRAEPGELQKDEVASVFWKSPPEIKQDMQRRPEAYAPGFIHSIDVFLASYTS